MLYAEIKMSVEHLTIENPKELMEIVSKELEGIEKGLKMIGNDIPVDEKTKIGMLCHDENGQLVIVEPALEEGENLVIQALKCADFVDKFKMMLAATNPKSKVDATKPPRVILLLPECSEETVRLVKRIKDVRIDLYTWEYLKIGDSKGLHIEPILISSLEKKEKPKEKEEKKREKAAKKKEEPKPAKPAEPKEEEKKPLPEPKPEPKEEKKPEPEAPKPKVTPESIPMKPKEEKKERKKLRLF